MNKIYRILGEKGRITIPYEIRKYVGFKQNDILSFYVQDDRDILIKKEKLCGECTEEIKDKAVNDENITLREFLDSLSEAQKEAAYIYLSFINDRGKTNVFGGECNAVKNTKSKK